MVLIDELTIDQVHSDFKSGVYNCRQLVEAYLKRISDLDQAGPKLNAITVVSRFALENAESLDSYFKNTGSFVGPLHGVPVIVKDQCDTKGIETTYGNICCKHVPTEDSTLVKKLKEAGAVILAKSTMPGKSLPLLDSSIDSVRLCSIIQFCIICQWGDFESIRYYSRDWRLQCRDRCCYRRKLGLIGVGEDTGGSIRVPASFCNLVGLRPSVGLISRNGLSPLVKTQDTPGPMTRTVRDAALMLDVLAGHDPKDPYTATAAIAGPPKGGSYAANLTETVLSKARIGVLNSVFGPDSSNECAPVNKVVRNALSKLTATLIDVEIPDLEHYVSFSSTYTSRSRFDIDNFLAAHPIIKGVSTESIHSSKQFHQALPLFDKLATGIKHPYEDPQYAARIDTSAEFQRLVINIMTENKLDAIVYPSVQIPAPTIKDVVESRFKDSFPTNTNIGSQSKQPAISVPVGFTEAGLPVGLELLGIPYSEQKLLELAYGVEALMKARRAPVFK